MGEYDIGAQARLDEIKKRVDQIGEKMAADRATVRCDNCRHFRYYFAKSRSEKRKCVNPVIRTLAYSDRVVPKHVDAERAFAGACNRNGLLWQKRRPWDGFYLRDAIPLLLSLFIAGIWLGEFPAISYLSFLSFTGAILSAMAGLMWLIHCSIEGRWSDER